MTDKKLEDALRWWDYEVKDENVWSDLTDKATDCINTLADAARHTRERRAESTRRGSGE